MIAIATSTRADWGLLTPLAHQLREKGTDMAILASNMHLLPEMGMTVGEITSEGFEAVEMPTAGATPCDTYASTAEQYGKWLAAHRAEAIVILGDRYEMLAVASAALLNNTPIIHIAGGTVSEGATDNAIRNAISQLASLHLVETELCRERLKGMGIPESAIHVTGALGVWNALNVPLMTRGQLEESLGRKLPPHFFAGTLHAATLDTTTPEHQMDEFIGGLRQFFTAHEDFGAILTYPNNDTDPTPLIARLRAFAAEYPHRIVLVPSLGMRRYLSAVSLSEGVIGNSSSGVVEVASLGVPTLDIGIRQKGRERAPSVCHCEGDASDIRSGLEHIISPQIRQMASHKINPYFKTGTPEIMANNIINTL